MKDRERSHLWRRVDKMRSNHKFICDENMFIDGDHVNIFLEKFFVSFLCFYLYRSICRESSEASSFVLSDEQHFSI